MLPNAASSLQPPLSWHRSSVRAYLDEVLVALEDKYPEFIELALNWWYDGISAIDLAVEAAHLLRKKDCIRLLDRLNLIIHLKSDDIQMVSHIEDTESDFVAITTTFGSILYPFLSGPTELIRSEDMRSFLRSASLSSIEGHLLSLSTHSALRIAQIIQFELDRITELPTDPPYQRTCIRSLLILQQEFHCIPPSLFIKGLNANALDPGPVAGGTYSDVWKGVLDSQPIAVKILRFFIRGKRAKEVNVAKRLCDEALWWHQLDHPNILPFLGLNSTLFPTRGFCMLTPWMSNGNIMEYLLEHPDFDRLAALLDVAKGLEYLHSYEPQIIHGDLKGSNILVQDDLTCCLSDYGFTYSIESCTSTNGPSSTRWFAPEVLSPSRFSGVVRSARDVYAFGCAAFEIFTGEVPLAEQSDAEMARSVVDGIQPSQPNSDVIPEYIWTLLTTCWDYDSHRRPTAASVIAGLSPAAPGTILQSDIEQLSPSTANALLRLPMVFSVSEETLSSPSSSSVRSPSSTLSASPRLDPTAQPYVPYAFNSSASVFSRAISDAATDALVPSGTFDPPSNAQKSGQLKTTAPNFVPRGRQKITLKNTDGKEVDILGMARELGAQLK